MEYIIKEFDLLKQQFSILKSDNLLLKQQISILENESNLLERDYQKHLSKLFNGNTHLKNKYGITDITTDNCHIEIKNWINYKHCLGQLIAYNLGDPKDNLIAAFFGNSKCKEKILKLFHNNKINVWEINIINNELLIEKYPYIPTDTLEFIENHLLQTNNHKDKIKLSELQKFITNTKFIPLIGYKLINTDKLPNLDLNYKIKNILLENFEISENRDDFVKVKEIKDVLKKNDIIEKDLIKLKYIVEDAFEGIEFRENTTVNNKHCRNIFLQLNIK
jgi:hypothetical protein